MKDIERLGLMIDEVLLFAQMHDQPFIAHLLSMASLEISEIIEKHESSEPPPEEGQRDRKFLKLVG